MTNKFPRYWKPLVRIPTHEMEPEPEEALMEMMSVYNISREEAVRRLKEYNSQSEYWVNDRYQVQLRHEGQKWCHLNIRARDGGVIFRDWRHFQAIKNQLVGEECEAIELYPAESRLVDASNKYHLWCCKDPTFRFDIGFRERDVNYDSRSKKPGLRQRSF